MGELMKKAFDRVEALGADLSLLREARVEVADDTARPRKIHIAGAGPEFDFTVEVPRWFCALEGQDEWFRLYDAKTVHKLPQIVFFSKPKGEWRKAEKVPSTTFHSSQHAFDREPVTALARIVIAKKCNLVPPA